MCKNETFSSRALSARVATHNLRVVNESDGLAEEVRRLASEITKAKAALPAGEWNGKNGGAGGKERRKRSGNGGGGGGVGGRSDEGEGDDDAEDDEPPAAAPLAAAMASHTGTAATSTAKVASPPTALALGNVLSCDSSSSTPISSSVTGR